MPYIEAKISKKLDEKTIELVKAKFGKAIECIPGKSESWLMVNIEDGRTMYFKGDNSADTAYISVSAFGKAQVGAFDALTKELCDIMDSTLGIAPDRTYITYHEIENWGWNGSNF